MQPQRLAFDRSLRTVDAFGRLRVERSNISKAVINPYLGSEIPNAELLGLEPGKVYRLLRHPDELAKAAGTFANLPLLCIHTPTSADDPKKEYVVGSTGSDVEFNFPYLQCSLMVTDADAIRKIESREQCELSSSYAYRADMTPGTFEGQPYDGVMRDLHGNHVALVEVGRAGPDVVVADADPFSPKVKRMKLTRVGLAALAALGATIRPKLAADAKMPDLSPALEGVKLKTLEPAKIAAKVHALVAPVLAKDMEMSPAELATVVEGAAEAETANDAEEDEDEGEKKPKANDGDPPEPPEGGKPKPAANDAALLQRAREEGASEAVARMQAIRQAERDVAPFIGEVVAMDSAEAVYKLALDSMKVDTKGMPPAAYRHVLVNLPKPGSASQSAVVPASERLAADAASAADFRTRFPNAQVPRKA